MGKTRISRRGVLGLAAGAAGAGLLGEASAADNGLTVRNLRVEWLSEPIGIDTQRPRFRWEIGADPATRGVRAKSARIIIARSPEAIAARRGDIWASGVVSGRFDTRPPRLLPLQSHTPYYWAVAVTDGSGVTRWSEPARFITGLIDPAEWQGKWIAAKPPIPAPPHARGQSRLISTPEDTRLPLFRKDFALDALPARAVVSVSGLGHFELTVNGRPVTDSVLNPGWTAYDRTIFYTTYDVAGLLRSGANRLGVRLGNGMYTVEKIPNRKAKFVDSFGRPKLILHLSLFHADGTVTRVVSDESWETIDGPILYSSIYAGEDVDGRLEPSGWELPGTKGDGWRPVLTAGPQPGRLRAQAIPPVRMQKRFETVAISEPKPGVFVYDLGENFAGRPEMVVRGQAGASVKLTPCETLGEDGLAWQKSFNAGPPDKWVLYNYTLAGAGDERFVPRFNYHGFRYIQVEGAAPVGRAAQGTPEVVSMAGQFLHTDLPAAGDFDSSDGLLVRTHHLIERAVLSNAYSVLTDCPHREKLGWLEQTHLIAPGLIFNNDVQTLLAATDRNMRDAQWADGIVPTTAPEYTRFGPKNAVFDDSPEWGSASVLEPWWAYRFYGDRVQLERDYA
ncbi:MAG TPA: family 78 glycoside hydrolase catalytic domain, partial [Asticcacaulis sp.]|nr:family 78 glycoside hydrolase catalytic domain [Asticcacaulis sp.]